MKKAVLWQCLTIMLICIIEIRCMALSSSIYLTIDKTYKISSSDITTQDVKISYKSENENIATVSSKGLILAKSVGFTSVKASTDTVTKIFNIYVKEETPQIQICSDNQYLSGFSPSSKYYINDELIIANSNGKTKILNSWYGKTISIIKYNSNENCCSDAFSLFISHTHDYTFTKTVSPNCTAKGYDIYTCFCGQTENKNYKNMLNHKLSEYIIDGNYHYRKCTRENCNYITEKESHFYDNENDAVCNACDYIRSVANNNLCKNGHLFSDSCDEICNICGYKRNVKHTYSNSCDTTCNECGFLRVATHKYDDENDCICNICGYERNISNDNTDKSTASKSNKTEKNSSSSTKKTKGKTNKYTSSQDQSSSLDSSSDSNSDSENNKIKFKETTTSDNSKAKISNIILIVLLFLMTVLSGYLIYKNHKNK